MKKRGSRRKCSGADVMVSPMPRESPNRSTSESPQQFQFNFTTSSSLLKKNNNIMQPSSGSPGVKSLGTISDLKDLVSSRLDSIKRHLDHSHSEILKDIDASHSRLHKRFKIQTQSCQHMMDEAEKDHKKMTERIIESRDAMKASYMEFIAEAQANASRVCKTSLPELSHSCEKAIDAIRSRYGIA